MLKRLGLALLLLTSAAYAQTPALIAHRVTTEVEGQPSTDTPLPGATAANAIIVITAGNMGVHDSDGHSFVEIMDQNGYDTHTSVWAAFGITVSSSDVITTDGNYGHISSNIMAFSNLASFDKSAVQLDTNTTPMTITLTPTNPNELLVAIAEGVYNTTPVVTMGGTPTWTTIDTGTALYPTNMGIFTNAYRVQGAGTPSALTLSATTNQYNGQMAAVLAFASAASPLPLTITNTSLPNIMRTKAYPSTCINVSGGSAPYTITLGSGTLPPGLTFDGHCITGNPTTSGTTTGLIFHVVDHAGATANSAPLSITVTPFVTTLTLKHPAYGFLFMPTAKRQLGVYEQDPGATGLVNYTIPEGPGFATLSCTTNCQGTLGVTITGAAGPSFSVAGTVGSYRIVGCNDFHITATSIDANEDGSHSTDTTPVHICKGDHLVDVQPDYNQAFFGQQKIVYAYVLGQVDQSGTWSCTAPDSTNCNAALADRTNRDTVFTAPSTVGRYKLTYTSASTYDGSAASQYAWIYVGGPLTAAHDGSSALPITKEHTEMTACFPDPAFGARSYTVKADGTGTYTHLWQLPIQDNGGGYIGRVFNVDTTGTSPTQYPDFITLRTGGTRDLPVVICGVTDSAGHIPFQQAHGMTNGPGDIYDGTVFQGGMVEVAPFRGSPATGYDTSFGPDHVNLMGFGINDSDAAASGNPDKIGVWGIGGRHLHLEGLSLTSLRDGALLNNNTIYFGVRWTEFQSSIGNYYNQCSSNPGYGDHCFYAEGMFPLFVGNHFGTLVPGGSGAWIKNRGGSSIMTANSFSGSAGYTNLWWSDMSDSAPYTNVEMNLGPIGDTNCGDSPYCSAAGVDLDERHIMNNEEALAHDYFYGNIVTGTNGAPMFSYSAQNSDGCVNDYSIPCTMGNDHTGGFMLWNNTFNKAGVVGMSNDVFYNNGYNRPGVYGWPRLTYQNNSFWTDGSQGTFQVDMSPQFQADFTTNMFATGTMSIATPILPGNTGWGNTLGGGGTGSPSEIWSAYSPKDAYLTGVTSANFLSTTPIPYGTDFKPVSGSPLIGAGRAVSNPLMSILPVRWEPDPVFGFMVARTDSVSTIGARSSGTPSALNVITTSLPNATVGVPYSYSLTAAGGTTPYTWALLGGTLPSGLTLNSSGVISGTPTTAGNSTSLIFGVTDAASGTSSSPAMSLLVGATALSVTTTSLPSGMVGSIYTSTTLAATGGVPPYSWVRTDLNPFPAGLIVLSDGTISGIPTASGTFAGLRFRATDAAAATADSPSLSIVIAPAVSTTPTVIKGTVKLSGAIVVK